MLTGKRMKQRRLQLGISQQDLAAVLQTTQNQIWRYENEKNDPTGEVIVAIAQALDISADWLLGLTEDIKPFQGESDLTDMEREIISIMRQKSLEGQRQLVNVAKAM